MAILDPSLRANERVSRFDIRCGTDRSYCVLASNDLLGVFGEQFPA